MIRRLLMRYIVNAIILISIGTYLIHISIGSIYVLQQLKAIDNASEIQVHGIPIFITLIPVVIPIQMKGMILGIFLSIFYTLFVIYDSARKIDDTKPIVKVFLLGALTLTITLAIEMIQSSIGIETGSLETKNRYIFFLSAMMAPISEEIGFRLTLLGVVSAILYMLNYETSIQGLFKALVHPYSIHKEGGNLLTLYIFTVIQAIVFGLAHVIGGGGWQIGKVTTATLAGVYLGYLYIKYGFTSSVLGHSFFNIYLLSIGYLDEIGQEINEPIMSTYSYLMLSYIIMVGLIYIAYSGYKLWRGESNGKIPSNELLDMP